MKGKMFNRAIALKEMPINCPKCGSNQIRKNGHRRGKQNHQCKNCGRQ
ncbi:transposase-like zinc-binding domain-containing protein [Crocosphaera sp. Alani8]